MIGSDVWNLPVAKCHAPSGIFEPLPRRRYVDASRLGSREMVDFNRDGMIPSSLQHCDQADNMETAIAGAHFATCAIIDNLVCQGHGSVLVREN
jgi:hypothetical protein